MRRVILAVTAMLFSTLAFAQAPAAPKATATKDSASVAGAVCDLTFISDGETADGRDTGMSYVYLPAVPMADVNDDHKRLLRVLDAASKEQDKGGPYNVEFSEFRSCDGGDVVKITDGSILIQGMTLKGANRVARVMLKESDGILQRYEQRATKGDKTGWDHGKAKKVKRDDLQRKVRE